MYFQCMILVCKIIRKLYTITVVDIPKSTTSGGVDIDYTQLDKIGRTTLCVPFSPSLQPEHWYHYVEDWVWAWTSVGLPCR
jgi:hypothetical protein